MTRIAFEPVMPVSDNIRCRNVQFYEDMSKVFGMLETATSTASAQGMSVSGRLRVGAPVAYGLAQILPRLPKLMEQWPQLDVELEFSDDTVDLVEDRIEVSIRIGQSRDLSLISKKIGQTRRIAVASPSYLQKYGAPQHPSDLEHHQCIIYTRLAQPTKWLFRCPLQRRILLPWCRGVYL